MLYGITYLKHVRIRLHVYAPLFVCGTVDIIYQVSLVHLRWMSVSYSSSWSELVSLHDDESARTLGVLLVFNRWK